MNALWQQNAERLDPSMLRMLADANRRHAYLLQQQGRASATVAKYRRQADRLDAMAAAKEQTA